MTSVPNKNAESKDASPMPRIAIIGGGPAGLSLAKLLKNQGLTKTTVFEALPDVGGKSYTVYNGKAVVEMGTCYATFSHRITNRWMKQLGMPMTRLGIQRFDGEDFVKYIRAGSGPNIVFQLVRYWYEKARLFRALKRETPPEWALKDAAAPIIEWLNRYDLGKIENFMHRSTTNIAYGFVDETPTVQALRWNDVKLVLTGLFNQLKMPVEGWTEFWRRIAADLDVRTNQKILSVVREAGQITLITQDGTAHTFDQLVCTIPMDEFNALAVPTSTELEVAAAVSWNGYTTTLFAAQNWFTDVDVESYKEAVVPGAELGQLLSARYEGVEPDLGGDLYLSGQLSGKYSGEELREMLKRDVAKRGGKVTNVVLQKMWKYFARYRPEAIEDGLLTTLKTMQGEQNTWYSGAIFSHEAVSHIVEFNAVLAKAMKHKLAETTKEAGDESVLSTAENFS